MTSAHNSAPTGEGRGAADEGEPCRVVDDTTMIPHPGTRGNTVTSDQPAPVPAVEDGPRLDLTARITGVYVALTQVQTAHGQPRYRRKVHLSLDAAQKAVQRARSRGLHGEVHVCELRPITGQEGTP
ncbi:hypothetical protein HNR09_002594 [Nesterenkonia xinjiangensis]|uniref:Uncharacterized protein n=1 Tax=Nesterenkonia xinjiangensis TaxID=225327 RepID=A0A7Z0GQC7_9MICC|nr:hypothetical protein [Nesterenkonia xinjiangensis]